MAFDSPSFELTDEQIGPAARLIAVRGEIHVTTAPEFSTRLNEVIGEGVQELVLDLSDVGFIDSTGLSVLLNGLRRVTRSRGRLALVISNPTVLRLFEITKLDTTFDIRPTREEALARVAEPQAGGSSEGAP